MFNRCSNMLWLFTHPISQQGISPNKLFPKYVPTYFFPRGTMFFSCRTWHFCTKSIQVPLPCAGCPRRDGWNWAGQLFGGSARHDFAAASCGWATNNSQRPGAVNMGRLMEMGMGFLLMTYLYHGERPCHWSQLGPVGFAVFLRCTQR